MRVLPLALSVLVLGVLTGHAQQTPVVLGTCAAGSVAVSVPSGVVTCTPTPPPTGQAPTIPSLVADPSIIDQAGASVLRWTLGGGVATSLRITPGVGGVGVNTRSRTVRPTVTTEYTLTATNATGSATATVLVTVGPPPPPPPPTGDLFGAVDPSILGTCSAAAHDAHAVVGTDGVRYRTWHPQTDPTGCIYAHEHGDNPAHATQPDIVASLETDPLAFGFIGRLHGDHDEPHEGFKVFLAKRGQVNDEDRTNLTDSLSVFHMGTGGPRRAVTQFHSNDLRVYNPDVGFIHTRLMMDTGDKFDNVCDPRGSEPTKDGFSIPNRCKVNSGYEIWATVQCIIRTGGQLAYCPRAVPAVFDPITVFNRANPTEVVYAWDDRFKPYRNFPGDDWTGNRGCIRENYAQVGYSQNQGGPRVIYTNAMGQEVAQTDPGAIKQIVPTVTIVDHRSSTARPGEAAGNQAFKLKVDYCGTPTEKARLGLRN